MACDTQTVPGQTLTQRKEQVKSAVDKLEKALQMGEAKVVVGPTGGVSFKSTVAGRKLSIEDDKITDACAYRRLLIGNSPALRLQLARAEALAGRKVDPKAVAAGVHSHDGGKTWSGGHR